MRNIETIVIIVLSADRTYNAVASQVQSVHWKLQTSHQCVCLTGWWCWTVILRVGNCKKNWTSSWKKEKITHCI